MFWGLWTFWDVFYVQQIIDLFTILTIFYKFGLIRDISFSYEPSRQYDTSPFLKNNFKKIKMIVKGYRGNPDFLIELPIELPIALPIESL